MVFTFFFVILLLTTYNYLGKFGPGGTTTPKAPLDLTLQGPLLQKFAATTSLEQTDHHHQLCHPSTRGWPMGGVSGIRASGPPLNGDSRFSGF